MYENDEAALDPAVFFRTIKVREAMRRAQLLRGRPTTAAALARLFKREIHDMREDMGELTRAGLVAPKPLGRSHGYVLTDEGEASLRWSAPPPPGGVIRPRWVGVLARAIAEHHGIEMRQMLRDHVGSGVVARSRLVFALWARGWAFERIEEHFALPPGWARRGVERWKRLRENASPRSGAELREWRKRLGLTQKEAAERLGVCRSTIYRAELNGDGFTSKMLVGRA